MNLAEANGNEQQLQNPNPAPNANPLAIGQDNQNDNLPPVNPNPAVTQGTPAAPATNGIVSFNPLQDFDFIDNVATVEQFSLSANVPHSNNGVVVTQSFTETPTASLKPGNVVIIPKFQAGQQPTYETFLAPDVYFVVKSKSSDGKTIFLIKLQLSVGDDAAQQILRGYGIQNPSLVQLTSSDIFTVLVLAGHLLDSLKLALSPNTLPSGITLTGISSKPQDDETLKPISANERKIKQKAHVLNLFHRPRVDTSTTDHLINHLGPSMELDSAVSFSALSTSVEGNHYATTSIILSNKKNAATFKEFVWIVNEPTFDKEGVASHLHPILVRNPSSKFSNRGIQDIKQDISVLITLCQAIMGIDQMDGSAEFVFAPMVRLLNSDRNLAKVSAAVIDNEISKTMAAVSRFLYSTQASGLTRHALLDQIQQTIASNFQADNIVRENSLATSNADAFKSKYSVHPMHPPPLLGKKRPDPPQGGKGGNNPNPPKVKRSGSGSIAKTPCHNFKAHELGLPNANPCSKGNACPYDHTDLPPKGTMSQTDKDVLCAKIKRGHTPLSKKIIDALKLY